MGAIDELTSISDNADLNKQQPENTKETNTTLLLGEVGRTSTRLCV